MTCTTARDKRQWVKIKCWVRNRPAGGYVNKGIFSRRAEAQQSFFQDLNMDLNSTYQTVSAWEGDKQKKW